MSTGNLHIHGLARVYPGRSVPGTEFGMPAELGRRAGFAAVHAGADPARTIDLWQEAAELALRDAGSGPAAIQGVIAVRSGSNPRYDGAWLSLALAHRLGLADPLCVDLKGSGCAAVLHALSLVARMDRPEGDGLVLLVGGGASGYSRRWLPNPPGPSGETESGVLVGDGAHAVLVGRSPGRYEVLAVEALLDGSLACAYRREGPNYHIDDDDSRAWSRAASGFCTRVLAAVVLRAEVPAGAPMFFVGTNAGRESKTELCRKSWRKSQDPRFRAALEVQLQTMEEFGHLFGGDAVPNLCSLRDASLVRPGDLVLCMEAGGTYLYSAAVLRALAPSATP